MRRFSDRGGADNQRDVLLPSQHIVLSQGLVTGFARRVLDHVHFDGLSEYVNQRLCAVWHSCSLSEQGSQHLYDPRRLHYHRGRRQPDE